VYETDYYKFIIMRFSLQILFEVGTK